MGTSVEPVGEVRVLGQSQVWPAVAVPGVLAIVILAGASFSHQISWYAVAAVGASLILAYTRRQNAVLADDVGLLLRGPGGLTRSYAWTEIERMGWVDAGIWGSKLELNPRGGPYDVPGPNSATDVARIWRPRRRRSADPLPELIRRHGIKTLRDR
jgi:hypothetical protein